MDVAARARRERAERERRLEDLAVQVLTAVAERDEAVADTERRAGAALRQMTAGEGLTLREAAAWCGDRVSAREATRLRQLAGGDGEPEGESDGAAAGQADTPAADVASDGS